MPQLYSLMDSYTDSCGHHGRVVVPTGLLSSWRVYRCPHRASLTPSDDEFPIMETRADSHILADAESTILTLHLLMSCLKKDKHYSSKTCGYSLNKNAEILREILREPQEVISVFN